MRQLSRWRVLWLAGAVMLLAACENSATAYRIDSRDHALTLVREQPYFWTSEVNQYIVVARMPHCQRKVAIHPDERTLTEMRVYQAGEGLWALHQGERWYLAATESCRVQDWSNEDNEPPGPLVGTFRLEGGDPIFAAAD